MRPVARLPGFRLPIHVAPAPGPGLETDPGQASFEQGHHCGPVRYESPFCHVQKKTVFYNANDIPYEGGQGIGILDFAGLAIEN